MPSLLENKLLLQYLNAAGQDIAGGNVLGANVGKVTEQNIQAQNYAKLLRQILTGGGKMTMDAENINIKAPVTALSGPGGVPTGSTGATNPGAMNQQSSGSFPSVNPAPNTSAASASRGESDLLSALLRGNFSINPYSSPLGDISPSDLAGLTPQDISQALQFKFSQDEIARRAPSELINDLYKVALIDQINQPAQATPSFPVPVPGIGAVNIDEWKALPTDIQSYAAYVYQSKLSNPGEPVMSQEEWKRVDGDTKIKYLEELLERPELLALEERLRKSSATNINIGEQVERKKALGSVEGQLHFTTGKFVEDVEKFKNSDYFKDLQFRASEGDEEVKKEAASAVGNYINTQIEAKGGDIQRVEWGKDGKTAIWTVTWPDGETTKVRYRVRD